MTWPEQWIAWRRDDLVGELLAVGKVQAANIVRRSHKSWGSRVAAPDDDANANQAVVFELSLNDWMEIPRWEQAQVIRDVLWAIKELTLKYHRTLPHRKDLEEGYAKTLDFSFVDEDGSAVFATLPTRRPDLNNAGVITGEEPQFECDGAKYRSRNEVLVAAALWRLQIPFMPLPLMIVPETESTVRRFEPDFLLFLDHRILSLEVDGPSHDEESEDSRAARRAPLLSGGVAEHRLPVQHVKSVDGAMSVISDLLRRLPPT